MKKGLAVAMAALLGVATMGTTAMAAASGDITICRCKEYKFHSSFFNRFHIK